MTSWGPGATHHNRCGKTVKWPLAPTVHPIPRLLIDTLAHPQVTKMPWKLPEVHRSLKQPFSIVIGRRNNSAGGYLLLVTHWCISDLPVTGDLAGSGAIGSRLLVP